MMVDGPRPSTSSVSQPIWFDFELCFENKLVGYIPVFLDPFYYSLVMLSSDFFGNACN